jgi:shikimate dehydrogenase
VTAAWSPTARTRVAAVIGHPVRHSLSPVIHNAGFRALDLDWVYLAFEVDPGAAGHAIAAARVLGVDGLNVTMPHKAEVAAAVDRLSPVAAALGAVNTVVRDGDDLVGESTDGDGFLRSLDEEAFDPAGRRCVVLGAGGAARAVVHALARAGAGDVAVVARRPEAAAAAASLGGWVADETAVDDAELVVNATPVGMRGVTGLHREPQLPLDVERLHVGQLVVDLVYDPLVTPLLDAAKQRGAATLNGVGMLLHQAALAFERWTAQEAPLPAMSAALLGELAHRAEHP